MTDYTVRLYGPQADAIAAHLDDVPARIVREPVDPDAAGHKVLIAFRPPDDEPVGHYDWIHVAGAGIDKIAAALEGAAGPPVVTRTTGAMGRQIGEYALSYALSFLQEHSVRQRLQDARRWDQDAAAPGFLFDRSVTVIGTGAIGRGVADVMAPLAKSVTGVSASGRPRPPFTDVRRLASPGALEGADIVVAALPLTPDTESLLDETALSGLDGALFINVGRGATVDLQGLRRALGAGSVAHAVLDVLPEEPLPQDHWAWRDARVTVTPHVSGITRPVDVADAFRALVLEAKGGLPEPMVDLSRGY